MALRIKNRWHNSGRNEAVVRALEDQASAFAFIAWKLATDCMINMEKEGFVIDTPPRTIEVAVEYMAFSLQVADRLAYTRMEDDDREVFIHAVADNMIETICSNLEDIFGPNDYEPRVREILNDRADGYSDFNFDNDEPSYPFLGYFGLKVEEVMKKENERWVKEHIMEIEGPKVVRALTRSMNNLFGSGGS